MRSEDTKPKIPASIIMTLACIAHPAGLLMATEMQLLHGRNHIVRQSCIVYGQECFLIALEKIARSYIGCYLLNFLQLHFV